MEQLAKSSLNGTQYRVLMVVLRYTMGFHRNEHNLSLSFLSRAIGSKYPKNLPRDLNSLVDRRILKVRFEGQAKFLGINCEYSEWEMTTTFKNDTSLNSERSAPIIVEGDPPLNSEGSSTINSEGQEINYLNKPLNKIKDPSGAGSLHRADNDLIDRILDCFCEEYERKRGEPFELINIAKEKKAISKLFRYFQMNWEERKNDLKIPNFEDTEKYFRNFFSLCVDIRENFHYQNMSPTHIVSKLNAIKTIIGIGKSGKAGRRPANVTERDLLEITAKYFR